MEFPVDTQELGGSDGFHIMIIFILLFGTRLVCDHGSHNVDWLLMFRYARFSNSLWGRFGTKEEPGHPGITYPLSSHHTILLAP